jgi:hypothetical protein
MKLFVIYSLIIFISFSISITAQDSGQTKFNLTGSTRFRLFDLNRDIPLKRTTSTFPVYDYPTYYNYLGQQNYTLMQNEVNARLQGKPTTLSPKKESNNYMDSRVLLNLEFATSQNFDGVVGVQVGDVTYGGRGISPKGPNANNSDPYLVGSGSGGELQQTAGVNLQMNLMYVNYRIRKEKFYTRIGIQLFSSAQGRVMFSTGAGILANKDFVDNKISIESGLIKARERSLSDIDSNGFNDKNKLGVNIVYTKLKYYGFSFWKPEFYTYISSDTDITDVNQEKGNLFWHGLFNEFTKNKFLFIVHGIFNHGTVSAVNFLKNSNAQDIYNKRNTYHINGAMWDLQLSYFLNGNYNFNLIAIGTTGRPGYDKDGMSGSYKGSGYRTLAPGFSVSNIAIDFTGGYALFNATNMSGLSEFGGFINAIMWGPFQFTLGYYQLYATRTPYIQVNRDFNPLFNNKASNYLGQEFNLNLRWSVFTEFQIIIRSGLFQAGSGLKAINDHSIGNYAREAFISGEYKF